MVRAVMLRGDSERGVAIALRRVGDGLRARGVEMADGVVDRARYVLALARAASASATPSKYAALIGRCTNKFKHKLKLCTTLH